MKSFLHFLLSVILFFLFLQPVHSLASDVAGEQLTFRHLAGNNYRFRYILYRDCFGTPAPSSVILYSSSLSCGISQTYTMNQVPGTGTEISNGCNSVITTCNAGSATGVQKWEYEVDVALQGQCSDWSFGVPRCCFSAAITTVINVNNQQSYAEAHLNNVSGDDSSPQFLNDPKISVCQNQDFHYNNGVVDEEGDSLYFILTPVLSDSNQYVNYIPGYTNQQPLSSFPFVTLDSITGDLFIHPTSNEVGLFAYTVQEFRNGDLIGSVTRTILIQTIPCTNRNPTLTGINGTAAQVLYAFPGTSFCFDVYSDDPDTGQVLTVNWNHSIPAATFTHTGLLHPTGTFCWATSVNDLRPQPYEFTVTVADNNCPYIGVGVYSYLIYVTLDSSMIFLNAPSGEVNSFFSIYPNPANGVFIMQSEEKFPLLKIYNSMGECILKKEFENRIDLSDEPPGIYFVEAVMYDGKVDRLKIVKD